MSSWLVAFGGARREERVVGTVRAFLDALRRVDLERAMELAPGLMWFGQTVGQLSDGPRRFFSMLDFAPGEPRVLPDLSRALALEPFTKVTPRDGDLLLRVDCAVSGKLITLGVVASQTVRSVFDPMALVARLSRRA